jgi:hypothetical protein
MKMKTLPLILLAHVITNCKSESPTATFDQTLLLWKSNEIRVAKGTHENQSAASVNFPVEVESFVNANRHGQWITLAVVEKGRRSGVWLASLDSLAFQSQFRLSRAITSAASDDNATSVAYSGFSGHQANPHEFSVFLWKRGSDSVQVLASDIFPGSTVDWRPYSPEVAYVDKGGWIEAVDVTTLERRRLGQGNGPTWSPDGSKLAYASGKRLYVYDELSKATEELHTRRATQTDFRAHIYWDANGKRLFTNAPAGSLGYDNECMMTDLASGLTRTIYKGEHMCGPALSR